MFSILLIGTLVALANPDEHTYVIAGNGSSEVEALTDACENAIQKVVAEVVSSDDLRDYARDVASLRTGLARTSCESFEQVGKTEVGPSGTFKTVLKIKVQRAKIVAVVREALTKFRLKDVLSSKNPQEFQIRLDAALARQWDERNFPGMLETLDFVIGRKLGGETARMWLGVVLDSQGMPESALAVTEGATSGLNLRGSAVRREQLKQLSEIQLRIEFEQSDPSGARQRETVGKVVRTWLKDWLDAAEPRPTNVSDPDVLDTALMLSSRLVGPRLKRGPTPGLEWEGGALKVAARASAGRSIPRLHLAVDPLLESITLVDADFRKSASQNIRLSTLVELTFVGAEPDEVIMVQGEKIDVGADGRTSARILPRRVEVHRRLQSMERTDLIEVSVGTREVALTPWPLIAEALHVLASVPTTEPLSVNQADVLTKICAAPSGKRMEEMVESVLSRSGAFIELGGWSQDVHIMRDGHPMPVVRCRGRDLLSVPSTPTDIEAVLGSGRKLSIRANDRTKGQLNLVSFVQLTSQHDDARWRRRKGDSWKPFSEPVSIAPTVESETVEVARPRLAPTRVVLAADVATRREKEVQFSDVKLRPDAAQWQEGRDQHMLGWYMFAVPAGLGLTAAGVAAASTLTYGSALAAADAYGTTASLEEATDLRTEATKQVALANTLATIGGAIAVGATLSLALPAGWLWVISPEPSPIPEFLDGE